MKYSLNTENINYIKIFYKDNNGFSHFVKASIKNLSEKEIYALTKSEEKIFIKTPQDVKISIAADSGLYKAETVLKYTLYEEPYLYFAMKMPDDMQYCQNREYFRVKLDENALLRYQEGEIEKRISCETYDLSANGVKIILDKHIVFPENVEITLYFNGKNIETQAKYIRTDEEDNIYKASFCFVNLKETDLDYISQVCFKKQLETRRKNFM